jgi:hypothetical protein
MRQKVAIRSMIAIKWQNYTQTVPIFALSAKDYFFAHPEG